MTESSPTEQEETPRKRRTSLRVAAYETLRERIIGLDLRPGQRLVERDLAEELGVSRVPLREALHMLEADGLAVIVPHQGAMVAPFTAQDVEHLFEVREYVEVLAARLAARRRRPEDVARLEELTAQARAAVAAGDAAAAAAANAAFHRAVAEASANPLVAGMTGMLDLRVRWLFHLTKQRDTVVQCEEHEEMLAAIRDGDEDDVESLAREHVLSGRAPTLAMAATWSDQEIDPVEATRSRRRGSSDGSVTAN